MCFFVLFHELLFILLFLQALYRLSDDTVIENARVNLAYKWFLRLNPEDVLRPFPIKPV
ncbi:MULTISPECIES: transposase [unclassified Peribacillus]|uniref:transposase n=1 Tax=unclassified Peribacillus TaxID=2675266 RepID=UPI00338D74A1